VRVDDRRGYHGSFRGEPRARPAIDEEARAVLDGDNDKKRVRLSEAERREGLAQLVLCRTKLSKSEAVLFREVFSVIVDMHAAQVRRHLARRALD